MSPRLPLLRTAVLLGLWGASLWSTLLLTRGERDFLPSVCGIWGCGPPSHVLLGWHLFWGILFAPPVILALRNLGPTCLLHLGEGLLATSLLMAAVVIGIDLFHWWPAATELQRAYLDRRILFTLATTVEIPSLQLLAAAALFLLTALAGRTLPPKNSSRFSCEVPRPA